MISFLFQKYQDVISSCLTLSSVQGRIQPVSLGGAISVIFGSQVLLRVHHCKTDEVQYTSQYYCDTTMDGKTA